MLEYSQTETEAAILEGVAQVLRSGDAGTAHRHSNNRIDRKQVATSMGLKDLGTDEGTCAVVLGTHAALPGMLVKVTNKADGFVAFAEAWLQALEAGEIMPTFFPEIYSVTYVDDFAVILVEKIEGREAVWQETKKHRDDVHAWCYEWVAGYCESGLEKYSPDFHSGNMIVKDDGTHVWIDPIWNPNQDEDLEPEEEEVDVPEQRASLVHIQEHGQGICAALHNLFGPRCDPIPLRGRVSQGPNARIHRPTPLWTRRAYDAIVRGRSADVRAESLPPALKYKKFPQPLGHIKRFMKGIC
jgi:hypothetical protein